MMKTLKFYLGLSIFISGIFIPGHPAYSQARSGTPDSTGVLQAVNRFVDAFTSLDWPKFTECFAEDATAYFPPSAKFPARANNKQEIEAVFQIVFADFHKFKTSPPYFNIDPIDLKIQMLDHTAIVTFMLNDPGMFGRRTLIYKNENGRWLIVHLHASGVPSQK